MVAFILSMLFTVQNVKAAGPVPADSPDLRARGQVVFKENCVACHGERGDGQGIAAKAIAGAKPRNFIEEKFKYGSKPEEVFKTISNGVTGSAMPSWSTLPESDRWAVIRYILSLKKKN